MQSVRVEALVKRYGATPAVDGVSLDIGAGEFFTLLGPSGCGKTTMLRLLAGLAAPDSGSVWFGGQRVDGVPAQERGVGMVFQHYAIFPHLSVFDNVAYGLRARRLPRQEVAGRAAAALALVQLADLGGRRPDQLSGGQQQRVALARALVIQPRLLLLDEPLSNLDARLRREMRDEIRCLQRRLGITTVYVTHDQEEALAVSDRVAVLERGRLRQVGSPAEVWAAPADRFVAEFLGVGAFLPAHGGPAGIDLLGARLLRPVRPGPVLVGLRPEWLGLAPVGQEPAPGQALLSGRVAAVTFLGPVARVEVALDGGPAVAVHWASPAAGGPVLPPWAPGEPVRVALWSGRALLFDPAGGGLLA